MAVELLLTYPFPFIKTKILLDALVGVMVADSAVSTWVPEVVVVPVDVYAFTTCNTDPVGRDALAMLCAAVVSVPAIVTLAPLVDNAVVPFD